MAHYSLFSIKKDHYSLIVIPHPDPHTNGIFFIKLMHTSLDDCRDYLHHLQEHSQAEARKPGL